MIITDGKSSNVNNLNSIKSVVLQRQRINFSGINRKRTTKTNLRFFAYWI